jgi:tRNA pseudouridine55 synthase
MMELRRERSLPLIGFLNCHKPRGMSSRDVVNVVQRRIRPVKVGHCGTLDPLAQGVLVLGVGAAVRLTQYVQQQEKRYVGSFRLNASSETGDLEQGCIDHPDLAVPTLEQMQAALPTFLGTVDQRPPTYSAVWVDGQRAYRRARKGEDFEVPARQVTIHQIAVIEYDFPALKLDITCGSGTYIRTLGIDLAKSIGSTAVMSDLVRTAIGGFRLADAVTIEQLREQPIEQLLQPAALGIAQLPRVIVDAADVERLGNGLCLAGGEAVQLDVADQEVAAITASGELRAILTQKPRGWCPRLVLPVADT